jgi:hypothetical protein
VIASITVTLEKPTLAERLLVRIVKEGTAVAGAKSYT